jgi:hypothetical protein
MKEHMALYRPRKVREDVLGHLIKHGCSRFVFYTLEILLLSSNLGFSEKERKQLMKDLMFANNLITSVFKDVEL